MLPIIAARRPGTAARSADRGCAGLASSRGLRLCLLLQATGAVDLIAQVAPDAENQRAVSGVLAQAQYLSRPGERHRYERLDAAGMRGHDDDAVAHRDRLVDAMGDEHDG